MARSNNGNDRAIAPCTLLLRLASLSIIRANIAAAARTYGMVDYIIANVTRVMLSKSP